MAAGEALRVRSAHPPPTTCTWHRFGAARQPERPPAAHPLTAPARSDTVTAWHQCWWRPIRDSMAPMDGSIGTEASDCVDVPPVRLCDRQRATAVDRVLGSAGVAVAAASDQDALVRRRASYRPAPETPLKHRETAEQSSAQAHSSCEQGAGQRDRGAQRKRVCARVRAHTHTHQTPGDDL